MGSYDRTIGVLLVGIFFNTYLFGLVSFQFITYYTSGRKDPLWIRIMVFIMVITDATHSISLIYLAWTVCVTGFGNSNRLLYNPWVYSLTPIFTAIASASTHIFLGHRIYRFTKSMLLYGFICVLAAAVFVFACIIGIRACFIPMMSDLYVLSDIVTAWVSLQVGIDIMIAGILVTKLYFCRTRFQQTNTVIHRLIRVAIQTGTFATIFAVGDLVSFLLMSETYLSGMFTFPIGRIYTNTMMDTLNMREALREILNESRTAGTFPVPFTTTTGFSFPSREVSVKDNVQSQSTLPFGERKGSELSFISSEGEPWVDRKLEASAAV
ncbi:hypothetical protein AX14_014452 [Amanita brunnescens Koide BX004]|nr:hypothetical protein AX14_014452 [Amanita brunnescens Koide BX004]